jgi:pSer/pThr/pTyr-binding forkhead associated (FHA) protein
MPSSPRKIRIGRDAGCDIVLSDRSVSRKHADLMIDTSGAMELLDLDSSSGTFLIRGGKEDSIARAKLKVGDKIRFGEVELTLEALQERVKSLTPPEPLPIRKPNPPPLPVAVKKVVPVIAATPTMKFSVAASGRMVRCECGSIKKRGEPCPSCGS